MSLRPTGIGATPTRESPSRDGGPGSMLLILISKVPWIPPPVRGRAAGRLAGSLRLGRAPTRPGGHSASGKFALAGRRGTGPGRRVGPVRAAGPLGGGPGSRPRAPGHVAAAARPPRPLAP